MSWPAVLILIGLDLILSSTLYLFVLRETKAFRLVVIRHRMTSGKGLSYAIILVVGLVLVGHNLFSKDAANIMAPILAFSYLTMINNYIIGDFAFDLKGLVQPEFWNKNYSWSEIDSYRLEQSSLAIRLDGKHTTIILSDKKERELLSFLEVNQLPRSNSSTNQHPNDQ